MGQVIAVLFLSIAVGVGIAFGDRYLLQAPEPQVRAAMPDPAAAANADPPGEVVLTGDRFGGGFQVKALVNGTKVSFLVNLRTDKTRLKMSDARRIGLEPDSLHFVNGPLMARGKPVPEAKVRLVTIEIGPLTVENMPAIVEDGSRIISIIGRDLIDALGEREVRDGELIIRPKPGRRS
jgi:clan AA aspartic protease (TIGR02281 family)